MGDADGEEVDEGDAAEGVNLVKFILTGNCGARRAGFNDQHIEDGDEKDENVVKAGWVSVALGLGVVGSHT